MKKINEAAFLKPWAMKEDVVIAMKEIVERHLKGEKLTDAEISAKTTGKADAPAYEVINGTARIPVYGVISKRMSLIHRISESGTSTLEIENLLQSAMSDPGVERILLDIDSPGGSSDGVLELSDYIFSLRGKKKIIAYANGQMCSAAYWLGSAADKVYASRGAVVGSIGVYAVVTDWTVANHNAGLKTEVITAGRNKAAGHPDKPFTQADRTVIQKEVSVVYDLFVEAVARNRGMSVEDVLKIATGDIFIGKDAVANGLVDGIKTFDIILNSSAAETPGKAQVVFAAAAGLKIKSVEQQNNQKEEVVMELKTATVENVKAENKAAADALITEGKSAGIEEGKKIGIEEGKASGAAEAKKAETERVGKIIAAAPVGMEAVALSAIREGKSLEEAKDMYLKAFKKEAPASPGASADPAAASGAELPVREKAAQEFEKSSALQAEFGSKEAYVAYKAKEAEGKARILSSKRVK